MRYLLEGLDCPHCAAKIEQKMQDEYGIEDASVNFATQSVQLEPSQQTAAGLAIDEVDPDVRLVAAPVGRDDSVRREIAAGESQKPSELAYIIPAIVIFAASLLWRPALQTTPHSWAEYAVFLTAYLLAGWKVMRRTARNLLRRSDIFDENFLMTIATFGAIGLGELPEAVGVMLFYRVGEYLQQLAVQRSRRSVRSLMQLRPDYARIERDGQLVEVPPEEVCIGDIIIVRPGERVPLDGVVQEGDSWVDTSALTGESVPREISSGDDILSGMVNQSGVLSVQVEKKYSDSQVARIMQLVEEAANRKAPTEQFITRFARYYTPAVVIAAASLALFPPLLTGASFGPWIYRSLTLLVISCPCALVISIPTGYFAGIGLASRHGILVKGANFLDALNDVSVAIFDKTGTLTDAQFEVRSVHPAEGRTADEVLSAAALAEMHSSHPVAEAIRRAGGRGEHNEAPASCAVESYREIAGRGVSAVARGQRLLVGSRRLMQQEGIAVDAKPQPGTEVFAAADGELLGSLTVSDAPREQASETIQKLRSLGVSRMFMLTGDTNQAAQQVQKQLNLDNYWAELLPEQKVQMTEEIKEREKDSSNAGRVAFIGDGINDAPVIAAADVGVAMGGLGSDAAIEAADVVVMEDELARLPAAVSIARLTARVIRQNVVMTLGLKITFLTLGALGLTTMWGAVFADVGVALLAVANSARILGAKF